ncbi:hypothetical protein HDU76_002274 [Blyttiomyces sp. JEL0837]|nr:hypothetical protein HDU76_002274 [Blyttiomyces sp. JEL0837]
MKGKPGVADATSLDSGCTPLHFAAYYNHSEVIKHLLNSGATVDIGSKKFKVTPLMEACRMGGLESVEILVREGKANLFQTDNMGRAPIHYAAKNGHYDVVAFLLTEGADCLAGDTSGNTPLHYAAGYGWRHVVKLLVEYGDAEVNAQNMWKCTPLMIADLKGHSGIVTDLLEGKVDTKGIKVEVNFLDKEGLSLLHHCVMNEVTSQFEADIALTKLKLLLSHGADINLKTGDGDTALHLLAMKSQRIMKDGSVVSAAVAKPAAEKSEKSDDEDEDDEDDEDDDEENSDDDFGLDDMEVDAPQPKKVVNNSESDGVVFDNAALIKYHHTITSLLVSHGAELAATNKEEKTPLAVAVSEGNLDIAIGLLRKLKASNGNDLTVSEYIKQSSEKFESGNTFLHQFLKQVASADLAALAVPSGNNLENTAEVANRHEESCASVSRFWDEIKRDKDVIAVLQSQVNVKNIDGMTPFLLAMKIASVQQGAARTKLKEAYRNLAQRYWFKPPDNKPVEVPTNFVWTCWKKVMTEVVKTLKPDVNATVVPPNFKKNEKNTWPEEYGFTLLHFASKYWLSEIMPLLLEYGCDPNVVDEKRPVSCLHRALATFAEKWVENESTTKKILFKETPSVIERQLATVEILLNHSADPTFANTIGVTPVLQGVDKAAGKSVEKPKDDGTVAELSLPRRITELLITAAKKQGRSKGLDVIKRHDGKQVRRTDGQTALMIALDKGDDDLAELLVDCGASLDIIGPGGVSTALQAIMCNRPRAAAIVKHASALDVADATGTTPLMAACTASDPSILDTLLNMGKDLNVVAVNRKNETALILACKHGKGIVAIERLITLGSNISHRGPDGKTALIYAIERNLLQVVIELIKHHAPVDVQDDNGEWALHHAVRSRNFKIVRVLLEAGARADVKRKSDDASALHIAVELSKSDVNKSMMVERALIAKGCPVNAVDKQGRTALHLAFIPLGLVPDMVSTADDRKKEAEAIKRQNAVKELLSEIEAKLKTLLGDAVEDDKASTKAVVSWFRASLLKEAAAKEPLVLSQLNEIKQSDWENSQDVTKSDPVEIVDYLLSLPEISIDVADCFGRSPLHYAARIGASSCADNLIGKGAVVDRKDADNHTPAQLALLGSHVDFFLSMALRGASIHQLIRNNDKTTQTMFRYSLAHNFMSIAYLIKNKGQDIHQAFEDALRTGKFTMAHAMIASAKVDTRREVESATSKTLLHILANFTPFDQSIWEDFYVNDLWDLLHEANVDINAVDAYGRTAIMCAAEHGQTSLVDILCSQPGINLTSLDKSGRTLLFHALLSESLDTIKRVIAVGTPIDTSDATTNPSAMRIAVDSRDVNIVKTMIEVNCNTDLDGQNGELTALMKAVVTNKSEIVKVLVDAGTDVNKKSKVLYKDPKRGNKEVEILMEPLIIAFERDRKSFEVLLSSGVNVNVIHPITGRTCLMVTMDGSDEELIKKILAAGGDVNIYDPKLKRTPFQRALLGDREDSKPISILQDFYNFKPDLSLPDPITGLTLLDLAVTRKNLDLIKSLLREGADPNVVSPISSNPEGLTTLILAVRQNWLEAVKVIVMNGGVSVNAEDSNGRNAMHHAVRPTEVAGFDNVEMIEFLAEKGVDFNKKDQPLDGTEPRRPIDYASLFFDHTMMKCLEKLGSMPIDVNEPRVETMTDNFAPIGDLEQDAEEERKRLEILAEEENEKSLKVKAKKMNITVDKLRQEEKKKSWATPDPKANVVENQVQVYFEGDGFDKYVPYDVLLHKCDVSKGIYGENKYYKMQVLHNHVQNIYFLFNKWGSLGAYHSDGMHQKTPFSTKEECIAEFKKVFKSKSGNEWNPEGEFMEKPGKYYLAKTVKRRNVKLSQIEYTDSAPSNHSESVQDIVRMFADSSARKGPSKMKSLILPAGVTLDPGVVKKAYDILLDIRTNLKEMLALTSHPTEHPSVQTLMALRQKIVMLSTDYFRCIPSPEFGDAGLKPILNLEALNQQMVKINNLLYLDLGATLLLAANHAKRNLNVHPLDYIISNIRCDIKPLDKVDPTNALIRKCVETTRAEYKNVEVVQILKVTRDGEKAAFDTYCKDIGNRHLLWHGSKVSNFLGILSSGLRVAPIEAAMSGYMFGKGVYFADVFCKSYGYTFDDSSSDSGHDAYSCLLLCEVALGTSYEAENAEYMEAPPAGTHSTKGLGMTGPQKENEMTLFEDGTKLSLGPISENTLRKNTTTGVEIRRTLNYNEYIVYNPSQIKIRYLVVTRDNSRCHLCGNTGSVTPCGKVGETQYGNKKDVSINGVAAFDKAVLDVLVKETDVGGYKGVWDRGFETKVLGEKLYKKRWSPATALTDESKICTTCTDSIMMMLLEDFANENKGLMPESLAKRKNCMYGRNCRTTTPVHRRHYNHFCDELKDKPVN